MVNRTSLSLPLLLSVNGGYVDTAGFLALQGLFTAHVTGNFVTIGAALAFGTAGVLNKLLALPVFCAVIIATRLAFTSKSASARPVLPGVLNLKLALLIVGAVLAVTLGPFKEADGWAAIVTGMTFVAAMAIQNAAHRIHMPGAPPTTLMTGTTTQIMIDLADMIRGFPPEARNAARASSVCHSRSPASRRARQRQRFSSMPLELGASSSRRWLRRSQEYPCRPHHQRRRTQQSRKPETRKIQRNSSLTLPR